MPDPLPVWQALVPMRAHVVERCQRVAGRARTSAVVALLELELSEVDVRLRDERILTGRAPQELDLQARAHGGGVRDDLPVQVSRLRLGLVRELGGAVLEDSGHHVQVLPDASAHAGDPVERNLRFHHPRVEHGGRLVAVHVAPQVDLDELVQVVRDGDDHYLGDLPCSDVAVLGVHKRVQRHARLQRRISGGVQRGVHQRPRQSAKVPDERFGVDVNDVPKPVARGRLEGIQGAENEEVTAVDGMEEPGSADFLRLAPSIQDAPRAPQVVGKRVPGMRKVLESEELLQEVLHDGGALQVPRLELLLKNDGVHCPRHLHGRWLRMHRRLQGRDHTAATAMLAVRVALQRFGC
mmetsp:Transcript_25309/g.64501  ORF Transcript_25309/g.64501 Transcript_25309/m.64501 type:complete len:352 (+) Transcript_25309:496-1551(+)